MANKKRYTVEIVYKGNFPAEREECTKEEMQVFVSLFNEDAIDLMRVIDNASGKVIQELQ